MHYWFADHTDFRSIKTNNKPDIFILGGVYIDGSSLDELMKMIQEVKSKYTHHNMPIKWNMRDLEEKYRSFDREDDYKELKDNSYQLRKEIFDRAQDLDYSIIISCIQSFQKGDKLTNKVKSKLLRYTFSNALMRVGMDQEYNDSSCNIVLDWPVDSNPTPFNREYYSAYNKGESFIDNVPYNSGKLSEIGFNDSVYFANMNHSVGLQFSDLLVGSFRAGIKAFRDEHFENLGIDVNKIYYPQIRTDKKGKVFQRGVLVSDGNNQFKEYIKRYLKFIEN